MGRMFQTLCALLLAGFGAFGSLSAHAYETHTLTAPSACSTFIAANSAPDTACINALSATWANAGCTGNAQYQSSYTWPAYADPAGYVQPPWSCATFPQLTHLYILVSACAATNGQSISGTVDRTCEPGAGCIPPQEVCSNSCSYGLSSAVAGTGLDGSLLWSGSWVGTGESCAGSPPTPDSGGETGEAATIANATKSAGDSETAQGTYLDDASAASIASRSNFTGASPVGSWYSLPSWVTGLLTRQQTDCLLHISFPQNGLLAPLASAVNGANVCTIQSYADSYGNWFIWFCAVLWSWAIVVGVRAE